VTEKRILVPFGPRGEDLISVHHALALAERLRARVFILQWSGNGDDRDIDSAWLDEALADLVASARLAGRHLSHLKVIGPPEEEVVGLIKDERIDYLVLREGRSGIERRLLQLEPDLTHRIIRVKERSTTPVKTSDPAPNRTDREL
jgi:hypothetical protein